MMLIRLLNLSLAWAAENHAVEHIAQADAHAIPWHSVFLQGFNLTFLLIVLFVVLRKTVITHFSNRAYEYRQMVESAEAARMEAEKGRKVMKERLARLDQDASQTVAQARAEAQELRSRMMHEANAIAQRLEQEAARTAMVEVEKAKIALRREILGQALNETRESMKKNISLTEQQKLQKEFTEKIQVVGG